MLHADDFLIAKNIGFVKFCLFNIPRATMLDLLINEKLDRLLTNDLESERHIAKFWKRVALAKFKNQRFTAKRVKNDITLLKTICF